LDVGLQSDEEEQEDHAQLGQHVQHRIVRVDQVQSGDADDDAADHLAQNGRLADALGELTEEFGGREDRQKGDQQFSDRHERAPRVT
jgi:hypothetical protein